MNDVRRTVTVSISYFDFDFGDDIMAANQFAKMAAETMTEERSVEIFVKFERVGDQDDERSEEQDN